MKGIYCIIVCIAAALSSCSLNGSNTDAVSDQLKNDTTAIVNYLSGNGIGATKLSQGIWFVIDSTGPKGNHPVYNDTLTMTYAMKLLQAGTVVDHATTPTDFVLSTLIQGLQNALPEFHSGSRGRVFIPSIYGYGASANGNISANSVLIFDFKLKGVKDHQLKLDTAAIDAYLANNTITAIKDPSGLRYTVDVVGSGTKPLLKDEIIVNYTLKTLDGTVIDQSTGSDLFLSSLILGWQIALPQTAQGSKITLYLPSGMAFGPLGANIGTVQIPANTNLIFSIELVQVKHH